MTQLTTFTPYHYFSQSSSQQSPSAAANSWVQPGNIYPGSVIPRVPVPQQPDLFRKDLTWPNLAASISQPLYVSSFKYTNNHVLFGATFSLWTAKYHYHLQVEACPLPHLIGSWLCFFFSPPPFSNYGLLADGSARHIGRQRGLCCHCPRWLLHVGVLPRTPNPSLHPGPR